MAITRRLTILARRYLPLVLLLLQLANEVLELVSKVVNYACRNLELQTFLPQR